MITGQPRHFKQGYKFFDKYLFQPNGGRDNFEILCHFWWNPENIGKPYSGPEWLYPNKAGYIEPDTEINLVNLYKPTNYIAEPQKQFVLPRDYSSYGTKTPPEMLYSCYYSLYQCGKMLEKLPPTKLCIFARYDWVPLEPVILSNHDPELFHMPNDIIPNSDNIYACNANFIFSSHKNMINFSKIYDIMDEMWLKDKCRFGGENICGNMVDRLGKRNPFPLRYAFIREWSDGPPEIAYNEIERYL